MKEKETTLQKSKEMDIKKMGLEELSASECKKANGGIWGVVLWVAGCMAWD